MKQYFDKVYLKSKDELYEELKKNIEKNEKRFIVTANPETFMMAKRDVNFARMLKEKSLIITPDGIGIVKCGNILGYNISGRITGVDLTEFLLKYGNEQKLSLGFLGAKQDVVDAFLETIKKNYPNLNVVYSQNGYVENKDEEFKKLLSKNPDIVLVALGMGPQEKLIYNNLKFAKKGILIGVGGSIDVLSGKKKRAPKFFQKLNLEWLYRITCEPKRISKFYNNNVKFIKEIMKEK